MSNLRPHTGRRFAAFTMLELLVVIVIVASIAALAVTTMDSAVDSSELTVARANLTAVRDAIMGSATAPGYLADMKHVPGFDRIHPRYMRIQCLLSPESQPDAELQPFDPVQNRGWRGPYLARAPGVQNANSERLGLFPDASDTRFAGDTSFAQRGFFYNAFESRYGVRQPERDRTIADPWGNPIVIQIPNDDAFETPTSDEKWLYSRVVSAGPNGVLETPFHIDPLDPLLINLPPADLLVLKSDARLAGKRSDGTAPRRGDDLVLFLNRPDVYETE